MTSSVIVMLFIGSCKSLFRFLISMCSCCMQPSEQSFFRGTLYQSDGIRLSIARVELSYTGMPLTGRNVRIFNLLGEALRHAQQEDTMS